MWCPPLCPVLCPALSPILCPNGDLDALERDGDSECTEGNRSRFILENALVNGVATGLLNGVHSRSPSIFSFFPILDGFDGLDLQIGCALTAFAVRF